MKKRIFEKKSTINASAQKVFDWHKKEEALEKLIPPWEPVEVVEKTGPIEEEGSRVVLKIKILGPISLQWISEHTNYKEGIQFEDFQVKGPFAHWHHYHRVIDEGDSTCLLHDRVEYALPLGWLGDLFGNWIVKRKIEKMFEYRHRLTREAMEEEGGNRNSQ